jgi:hypothetical protein
MGGRVVWEVEGNIPEEIARAILAHLAKHCDFKFTGDEFRLTGEGLDFYGALLCQLDLPAGCSLKIRRRGTQELTFPARFYFLYRPVPGNELLLPLSGRVGELVLAKRWFGLTIDDDTQRLAYARFYLAFGRTRRPPRFVNVPRSVHDLRLDQITNQRMWGIFGSMWRFGVNDKTLAVRPRFERRGALWFVRWRAHLPVQQGNELHDVDLHIWDKDGHVSFHQTSVIYRDPALLDERQGLPAKLPNPNYIRWHEALRALYRNFQTIINQSAYLATTFLFVLATAVSLLFPLEIYGSTFVRDGLEVVSSTIGFGSWHGWLWAASLYCIGYFALTTLLILDAATARNALLTFSPRLKDSWLDGWLYTLVRREHRIENGYRRGFLRRIRTAAGRLVAWTVYIVCVFTALQTSYRPELAGNTKALSDVWQVFAEQALLYVPVVFYYVGKKSLDLEKLASVSPGILLLLQLSMGLLVIRRIHRFWASTAAAKASN